MTNLLPCPFCGGKPVRLFTSDYEQLAQVRCENDECFGPHTPVANAKDAVVMWNRRAQFSDVAQPTGMHEASLRALNELVTMSEDDYCSDDTEEGDWREPDDEPVAAGTDSVSCVTFGSVRRAREAIDFLMSAAPVEDALGYAQRLATALWEKHYKTDAPEWKPLPDVVGVLTQIDNMTAGLQRSSAGNVDIVERVDRAIMTELNRQFENGTRHLTSIHIRDVVNAVVAAIPDEPQEARK